MTDFFLEKSSRNFFIWTYVGLALAGCGVLALVLAVDKGDGQLPAAVPLRSAGDGKRVGVGGGPVSKVTPSAQGIRIGSIGR